MGKKEEMEELFNKLNSKSQEVMMLLAKGMLIAEKNKKEEE